MTKQPALADIQLAADQINGLVMKTPCLPSETLSRIAGCRLHLKFENLQFTASFKERGALNKLLSLSERERKAGVCAMSAGNHAQGLAYHAQRLGIAATIVMPQGTPMTKVVRTREHGANVLIEGANLTEAMTTAQAGAKRLGLTFVHPFDDPHIIAGQGTLALEMLDAIANLEVIVIPIGGGGLISGVAIAAKQIKPTIKIVGVQSRTYPSMVQDLAGNPTPCADGLTIAEGIAVKTVGTLTRAIVRRLVDDIVLVEEASIERAIALLQSVEKTVVEGAGAAGLAAILEYPERFEGKTVATVLTGGNIDSRIFASVILRDLVRNGQLVHFSVAVTDQPGAMAKLSTVVGDEGANIVQIEHDRMSLALHAKSTAIRIVAEVQDREHGHRLLQMLTTNGFKPQAMPVAGV